MRVATTLESAASEIGVEILASLAEHRVLSAAQVRAIHLPESGERWAQRLLVRLGEAGLAGFVRSPRSHRRLWHVTVHHPLTHGRGRRRRSLVADAVLTYLRTEGEDVTVEQRFRELDRATLSVDRLYSELARYAQLHRPPGGKGTPRWRESYPVFPSVHCVLTGGRRGVLKRRRATTLALLRSDPRLGREAGVRISICLLEDLHREGPFAPIFLDVTEPELAVDWLGERESRG